MKKSSLAIIMFAIFSSTNLFTSKLLAQEVNSRAAKQLALFVKANADSIDMEGQATSYNLDYPENGFHVVASYRDSLLTLEIYPGVMTHPWCVNFLCQAGNIYEGLYCIKFSPTVAAKKVLKFDAMISSLNLITIQTLVQQRNDRKKLQSEFNIWASKIRSYEEYVNIDELAVWRKNYASIDFSDDDMDDKGVIVVDFLFPVSNTNIREILNAVQGK